MFPMRIERWYWLGVFCVISFAIHVGMMMESRAFTVVPPLQKVTEIEVMLPPPEEKKAEPAKPPAPKPKSETKHSSERKTDKPDGKRPMQVAKNDVRLVPIPRKSEPVRENRPAAAEAQPGGVDRLKEEKPLPIGLPAGKKDAGPELQRMARLQAPGGGGSPAPGIVLGGKGGAPGPITPPEDIVFNGGGAGGVNLPKAPPSIGGGGGKSILSVENPLAKELIPEEKPGIGPGLGGNQGHGAGGGVGVGRDLGIGTRLDGKYARSTLQSKPGPGIGASKGSGIGTNPPGGGKGAGSELPGTGGTGIGYGRGSGIGVGNGSGTGVGDGSGGIPGRRRGVPFGDIAGLLRGDPNGGGGKGGGPGGPGRGGVFGATPRGGKGGDGPLHIVYLLDVSGSMREGDKIGKAKEELKRALSELKRKDSFNIITFFGRARSFSDDLVPATKTNIEAANLYVDLVDLKDGTNISAALDLAFTMETARTFYLLSDGEPTTGIRSFDMLRQHVKLMNSNNVQIVTLALGLGEQFKGMYLLQALAEDNGGKFGYVNLSNRQDQP